MKEYLLDLSKQMDMPLGGKSSDVQTLRCDDRYMDPEYVLDP